MTIQTIFDVCVSVTLSLLLVAIFNDDQILNLLIILGQGHFLISYLYTHKAGKMNSLFRKKFFGLGFIVLGICLYVFKHQEHLNLLAFFTGVLFIFHYYNDELKIQGIKRYRFFVLGSLASMLAFSGVYANKLFNFSSPLLYILSIASLLVFFYFSYLAVGIRKNIGNNAFVYVLFFTFLNWAIPTLLISIPSVSVYQIFGFIILFHYFRWYIYYANIFKDTREPLYFYLKTIFNIHFLLIALYVQHVLMKYSTYLVFIFNPIFFYGWTIMHILLSVRKNDY